MAEKAKRKAEEEAEQKKREAQGELPPKKKRRTKKRQPIQANSAGEAIEKMLQEKRISNKINYDVLKSLSSTLTGTSDRTGRGEDGADSGHGSQSSVSPIRRLPSMRNILIDTPAYSGASTSPDKKTALGLGLGKRGTDSGHETSSAEASSQKLAVGVLPTDADPDMDYYEEDDEGLEEGYPGGGQLSIAELMGHHRGDDDGHDQEDFYDSVY
jgi:transcription factor IIIB subunit 2